MKKFFFKIILFLLPLFVLGVLAEYFLRKIPNDYKLKREYLDNHSNEIETLILGSSHTLYGLNPYFFSSHTFNAAYASQTLDIDLEILNKYLSELINLKTLIVPISYFTLWDKLEISDESWRIKNYNIYYNLNLNSSVSGNSEILGSKLSLNIKKLWNYYILNKPIQSVNDLGWSTDYISTFSKDLTKTGKAAALRHTKKIHTPESEEIFIENIDTMKSLIEISENYNFKLIFITVPVYHTYTDNVDKEQLATTIKTVENITSSSNCLYVNCLEDKNFESQDYYDGDHLNEIGTEKFSILINNLINSTEY